MNVQVNGRAVTEPTGLGFVDLDVGATEPPRPPVDAKVRGGRDLGRGARAAVPGLLGAVIGAAFLFITTLAALSSFANVQQSAVAAGYPADTSWWLPAMVDGGIFAFTALGLFVSWRWRERLAESGAGVLLLIRGIVWLLVGYTLVLNTGQAGRSLWDVAAHSVGGALVALSAEVIEQLLRKLYALPSQLARRIPRRRWFAKPLSTARIWLLMFGWDMTYAEVLASERQRIREKILDRLRPGHGDETDAQLMARAKPKDRQLLRLMDTAVRSAVNAEAGARPATSSAPSIAKQSRRPAKSDQPNDPKEVKVAESGEASTPPMLGAAHPAPTKPAALRGTPVEDLLPVGREILAEHRVTAHELGRPRLSAGLKARNIPHGTAKADALLDLLRKEADT